MDRMAPNWAYKGSRTVRNPREVQIQSKLIPWYMSRESTMTNTKPPKPPSTKPKPKMSTGNPNITMYPKTGFEMFSDKQRMSWAPPTNYISELMEVFRLLKMWKNLTDEDRERWNWRADYCLGGRLRRTERRRKRQGYPTSTQWIVTIAISLEPPAPSGLGVRSCEGFKGAAGPFKNDF